MPRQRHRKPLAQQTRNIHIKANRILNIILAAFILIIVRIWHLTVVQHDAREQEARRPQTRTLIESAKRGTIVDRFGLPLAVNRLQYNAALIYAPLRQMPAVRWITDSNGNRIKQYKRREYISKLSMILAEVLSLDANRLEDLIHSKGSLYNQIPFILKEEISEKEYYELKALERDWPGIQVQRLPRRHYPKGRVAGDILGFMGAISRSEYEKIIGEIDFLEKSLDAVVQASESSDPLPLPEGYETLEDLQARLQILKDKAYSLTDYVGKAGIEGYYECELRGSSGKKCYNSDARGNYLRELPGSSKALSGRKLQLTISSELQEFAEKLLIQNEQIRETRVTLLDETHKIITATKIPWIKGGAIVVMNPQTGEVLAMASHPRYNPNDFILSVNPDISKVQRSHILRWFEVEGHIADIWDQRYPLSREQYDYNTKDIREDNKTLSWELYLDMVLPKESPISKALLKEIDLAKAVEINACASNLLAATGETQLISVFEKLFAGDTKILAMLSERCLSTYKTFLEPVLNDIPTNHDRALLVDLCRLAVDETRFTPPLLKEAGRQSLSEYHNASAAMVEIDDICQSITKELYRDLYFAKWRRENEKTYLKQKRAEEKAQQRYAKPYLDLLDAKEAELFKEFWHQAKWPLIETFLCGHSTGVEDELSPYIGHFTNWQQEISQGAHQHLQWFTAYKQLNQTLSTISPQERVTYMQCFRGYRQLNRPLLSRYPSLRKIHQLEKHLAAAFYPTYGFGYGRSHAYRQATTQGSLFKLVTSYEAMIQRYEGLGLESPSAEQLNPLTIVDSLFTKGKESYLGYHADGKPLPRFYKGGRLPRSTKNNLGRLDLLTALEASNNPYFCLLAGDILHTPNDLAAAARKFSYGARTGIDLPSEISGKIPTDLETNRTGLYAMAIGQHTLVVTPLQTSVMLSAMANGGKILTPQIVKRPLPLQPKELLPMPKAIQKMLLEGMQRVVLKTHGPSIFSLSRLYRRHPEAISDYIDLKDQLLGKTGSAESNERLDLDKDKGVNIYNHIWFGGISYDSEKEMFVGKDPFGNPEIVVVVYLRYGGFGKEAGPIAAQIVAKWREIKASHG